ncbi:unnamed protein product (macronuclear) [Paramecium tetraurelia]|uniref:Uncharacterized protein n=1 Tax=Paramecium tetraurelia TaxID=5888 RepID=A0DSF6_PARTE|nr:uncharacterized protein GSPATT00019677001 [Paramecium tetraurelia]CAK85973.1 unnamed protein product [Paramecium tetraurelia]|eukprot:XP_001453370.1 hypothetical protein (macronuclear) [Paramecium tetraurelia strain d4-2]
MLSVGKQQIQGLSLLLLTIQKNLKFLHPEQDQYLAEEERTSKASGLSDIQSYPLIIMGKCKFDQFMVQLDLKLVQLIECKDIEFAKYLWFYENVMVEVDSITEVEID